MDVAAYAAEAAAASPMPFTQVPVRDPNQVVHIDGDFCAYNCSGNDACEPGQARRNLIQKIDKLMFVSGSGKAIVHLTGRQSTKGERYLAATVKPYQGQRQAGRKPRNWEMLREYMEQYEGNRFQVKEWLTREADDGMAYVAANAARAGKVAAIATADKDMRMLPGRHIIWQTNELVDIPLDTFAKWGPEGKLYGHKWFWEQLLQGDTADNIPGLERYVTLRGTLGRMGPATAAGLLYDVTNNADAYERVSGLYRGYYEDQWADRFAEQASLLWLRTDRHAAFDNFLEVVPPSALAVRQAAERLNSRILEARRKITEGEE